MKILNSLFLLLAFMFALTSCGEKDDPQPSTKDVKVVITGTNHGSALATNQTGIYRSTMGAFSQFEVQQSDRTDGYNDELNSTNRPTVSYDFPKLSTGTIFRFKFGFERIGGRPAGTTSMVVEVFVGGVSVKRMVCDSTTPGYNAATSSIIVTGDYKL